MSYTTLQLKTFSFELIYCFKMCFEIFFAECQKNNTRQRSSLPSVKKNTRQRDSLPSVKKNTRQIASLPSVKKNTRQRRLCRVPEKQHSANHLALGKEPVSGSDICFHLKALMRTDEISYIYRFFGFQIMRTGRPCPAAYVLLGFVFSNSNQFQCYSKGLYLQYNN